MLEDALRAMGHEVVGDAAEADLVVLNTCTVIEPTESRMLKRMAELSAQRKLLIVSGCMASAQADAVLRSAPSARLLAPRDYASLPKLVESMAGPTGVGIVPMASGVIAALPIAQGCLGSCTYCITKVARGPLVSRPPSEVAQHAARLIAYGAKEIQVTAQDAACYGADIDASLPDLMRRLIDLPGGFMLRVGMMSPDRFAPMLPGMADVLRSPKVFRFAHLPVQSGSDAVLRSMGRRYTAGEALDAVARLRGEVPDVTLSTDVITGFPGETDEDHRATMELVRALSPDIVNVTRFSPRPGTPASRSGSQVPSRISKDRSRELTSLRLRIASSKRGKDVGAAALALVTEAGKPGTVVARTPSYLPVVLKERVPLGHWADVEITGHGPTYLTGRALRSYAARPE